MENVLKCVYMYTCALFNGSPSSSVGFGFYRKEVCSTFCYLHNRRGLQLKHNENDFESYLEKHKTKFIYIRREENRALFSKHYINKELLEILRTYLH